MERGRSGRYSIAEFSGENVRAFVPFPLPPEPPVNLNGLALQRVLEAAHLALGRLDSLSALLPDIGLFLYMYVRKEALLSSQIEGTQSSLSELLLFELDEVPGVPRDDVVEVSNYVAALDHGLARLRDGFPLCNRLIREVHGVLLQRGRGSEKEPGQFRRNQNWIGGNRPGNAHFVPPPADQLEECMGSLEQFLHVEDLPLPTLVRAGLAHVQFETIHPFLDGNGRVGRLLITLLLCHAGVMQQPLLYLSLYFKQHRDEYYAMLDTVRRTGDWEAWLLFFLDGVRLTADGAVSTAQRLVALFQQDRTRIQELCGRTAGSALRVHAVLKERPAITLQEACRRTGLSHPTVSTAMASLLSHGIAEEITGRRRDRVFTYRAHLAILSEGTDPV